MNLLCYVTPPDLSPTKSSEKKGANNFVMSHDYGPGEAPSGVVSRCVYVMTVIEAITPINDSVLLCRL